MFLDELRFYLQLVTDSFTVEALVSVNLTTNMYLYDRKKLCVF